MIEIFILSTLRVSVPLCLATLGGFYSERSGVVNIALEGLMLTAAFSAAASAKIFHDPWIGFTVGVSSAVLLSMLHGLLCIHFRSNQIISGIAINLLAAGANAFIGKILFNMTGSTPALESFEKIPSLLGNSPFLLITLICILSSWVIFAYTRFGGYLRFAGEKPQALATQGVSVKKTRYTALVFTGVLCGMAGVYLSIDHGSSFVKNMTAGRGFIALAALIIGKWHPIYASLFAILFGAMETFQILLQGHLPSQWVQMLPFVLTLIAVCFYRNRKV